MMQSLDRLRRRWGLLLLITAAHLIASSIAITPWSEVVATGSLSAFPDPDAALFADGGMIFVEWLRLDGQALVGALRATLWLTALAALLLLLPGALLMVGLCDTERLTVKHHGRRAVAAFPPFLLLFGATLLCQALLVLLWVVLWGVCLNAMGPSAYPWLSLGFVILALLSWGLPSMLQDLTRAALITEQVRLPAAVGHALRLCAAHPRQVLGAYLVPAALAWIVAAVTLGLTAKLATYNPAGLGPSLHFALHQACVFLLVTLRAYWLQRALGLASFSQPALGDTREGSGELGGPTPNHGA